MNGLSLVIKYDAHSTLLLLPVAWDVINGRACGSGQGVRRRRDCLQGVRQRAGRAPASRRRSGRAAASVVRRAEECGDGRLSHGTYLARERLRGRGRRREAPRCQQRRPGRVRTTSAQEPSPSWRTNPPPRRAPPSASPGRATPKGPPARLAVALRREDRKSVV